MAPLSFAAERCPIEHSYEVDGKSDDRKRLPRQMPVYRTKIFQRLKDHPRKCSLRKTQKDHSSESGKEGRQLIR